MQENQSEQEKQSSRYSQTEVDQIMRGERPEGMDYEKFKYLRSQVKKMQKNYLKGQIEHLSSWIEPVEGTKMYRRMYKTYVKTKE